MKTTNIKRSKGGRPKQDSKIRIFIPGITQVIITPKQYDILIAKYDLELISFALTLLDDWLNSHSPVANKYIGKNNYAFFRSDGWVINEAKRKLKWEFVDYING